MKKFISSALSAALIFSLAACSAGGGSDATSSSGTSSTSAGAGTSASASGTAAQVEFPDIITVTVPFNAGSNTDIQMRFIQPYLEKHLGATLVINNAGGASGVIGTTDFISQAADGSNILFSLPTPTVYRPASGETTYTVDDLVPVSRITADPFYLAVSGENDQFPDGQSVLTYIQENPGQFTYANAGNGGIAHVAFASFLDSEGLDALSVPFTGGTADCYTAVMGGHVMSYSVSESELTGRSDIRPVINLGTKSTTPGFEDVPTLAELGYEGYETNAFAGFYYMKGVDEAYVEAFDAAVKATLEDEEFLAAAAESNFMHRYAGHEEFAEQVKNAAELAVPILEALQ
ncbi:tripartite tricarboxylate transporter substrate binding protein [Lawsonibacter sp. LCP25S3_G6]|uniref:tripartite tricarboxylate transporter substrate binding protein n=1 Tax=unclassified Lawsonibacter TaxID=2617946 RepID=UPI003F99136C